MFNPIGTAVKVLGKSLNLPHVELVGHYIEGSGKKYKLPERAAKIIRETFQKEIEESFCGVIYQDPKNLWKKNRNTRFILNIGDVGCTKEFSLVHRSVGKFILNHGILLDWYKFYPWCGNNQHFSECTCSQKNWDRQQIGEISFFKGIPFFKGITIEISSKGIKINRDHFESASSENSTNEVVFLVITILSDEPYFSIYLEISDKLMSKLGKPFLVYYDFGRELCQHNK